MKKFLTVLLLICSLIGYSPAYSYQEKTTQNYSYDIVNELGVTQMQFSGNNGSIKYCEKFINKNTHADTYLVVILHGRSGTGNDNIKQLTSPAVKPLISYAEKNNKKVIMIMPQCPSNANWLRDNSGNSPISAVAELVKEKVREYNIPANNVYITGISMGGGACYNIIARNPGLFSKAVLVSSGGKVQEAPKLKGSFLIIHGENDNIIPISRAKAMAEAIKLNQNANVKFIILANTGHIGLSASAYSDECWNWLFK